METLRPRGGASGHWQLTQQRGSEDLLNVLGRSNSYVEPVSRSADPDAQDDPESQSYQQVAVRSRRDAVGADGRLDEDRVRPRNAYCGVELPQCCF